MSVEKDQVEGQVNRDPEDGVEAAASGSSQVDGAPSTPPPPAFDESEAKAGVGTAENDDAGAKKDSSVDTAAEQSLATMNEDVSETPNSDGRPAETPESLELHPMDNTASVDTASVPLTVPDSPSPVIDNNQPEPSPSSSGASPVPPSEEAGEGSTVVVGECSDVGDPTSLTPSPSAAEKEEAEVQNTSFSKGRGEEDGEDEQDGGKSGMGKESEEPEIMVLEAEALKSRPSGSSRNSSVRGGRSDSQNSKADPDQLDLARIDLNDRDPHQINGELTLTFAEIFAEPDASIHSLGGVWRAASKVYSGVKLWTYRILTIFCAVPCACLWAVAFALLSLLSIWLWSPWLKVLRVVMLVIKRMVDYVLIASVVPVFEAVGRLFSGIRLHVNSNRADAGVAGYV